MAILKLIGEILIAVATVVGIIVAGIWMTRKGGSGAALAFGGFLALGLSSCGTALAGPVLRRLVSGRLSAAFTNGLSCILSAATFAGIVLLILAVNALARKSNPPAGS